MTVVKFDCPDHGCVEAPIDLVDVLVTEMEFSR